MMVLTLAVGAVGLAAQGPPQAAPAPRVAAASSGSIVEMSNEARFQMDYRVPEAVLAAMMPAGFTSSPATTGPATDCNLRVIFIDRVTINGPDGRPVGKGSSRLIYLEAPAKDPSGANVRVVIGGLTDDPADVPGPFGNYILATNRSFQHSSSTTGTGVTIDSQDWMMSASSGEHIEMHVRYERGIANRARPQDLRIYSAKNPALFQLSTYEQVLDILRNTTTNPPDRVKEYSFKAGGGSYAKLFDGTEKPLSWDNIPWLNRTVSVQ
jgi:hypothetical protein